MNENTKDSDLRNQIYDNMRLKDTEELVEIWKRGDRTEWSDTAFEVVKEILLNRVGEIPPQEVHEEKPLSADQLLHNEDRLMKISLWANIISWVILIGYAINFLSRLVITFQGIQNPALSSFATPLNLWVGLFLSLATGVAYFLILQAISQGIPILFNIEDNSFQLMDIFKASRKSSGDQ